MAVFITVLLMLSAIAVTATMTSTRNAADSAVTERSIQARSVATGALERFYAALSTPADDGDVEAGLRRLIVDNQTPSPAQEALIADIASEDPGISGDWWQVQDLDREQCAAAGGASTAYGCVVPCPEDVTAAQFGCYQVWWQARDVNGSAVTATARARVGCQAVGPSCEYVQLSQRMLRQQFFEYMWYVESTWSDPAGPLGSVPVPLTDTTNTRGGPIYAAYGPWYVCGSPKVADVTVHAGQPPARPTLSSWFTAWDACTGPASPDVAAGAVVKSSTDKALLLPSMPSGATCVTEPCATDANSLPSGVEVDRYPTTSTSVVDLAFTKDGYYVRESPSAGWGDVHPIPASGVITVIGNATVQDAEFDGASRGVHGRVSVFATGEIRIVGDVTYYAADSSGDRGRGDCTATPVGALDGVTDALGLNAANIILAPPADEGRTVLCTDAVMVSVDGSIKAEAAGRVDQDVDWYLYGSVAEKYQGIAAGNETTRTPQRETRSYTDPRNYQWYTISYTTVAYSTRPTTATCWTPGRIEEFGRAEGASCPSGWSPSWSQWPNGGTGGWVCSRWISGTSYSCPGPTEYYCPSGVNTGSGCRVTTYVCPTGWRDIGAGCTTTPDTEPGWEDDGAEYVREWWGVSYKRHFTHDTRFSTYALQPPVLLTPVNAPWKRLDVTEDDLSFQVNPDGTTTLVATP